MIPGDAVSPAMLAGIGLLAAGIGVMLILAVGLAGGGARPTSGRHRAGLADADTQELPAVAPAGPGLSVEESGALITEAHRAAELARAEAIRHTWEITALVRPYVIRAADGLVSAA